MQGIALENMQLLENDEGMEELTETLDPFQLCKEVEWTLAVPLGANDVNNDSLWI